MTTKAEGVTFGKYIRAMRLGFGHWKQAGLFLRISIDGPYFRVWMEPDDVLIECRREYCGEAICWWDRGPRGLAMSPAIVGRSGRRESQTFLVDDAGEEVGGGRS